MVTFITTNMVAVVALLVWRLPIYLVLPVYLIFLAIDGTYLSAVLVKVPQGAWFTIMLAFGLEAIFALWRYGKEVQWKSESLEDLPPSSFITHVKDGNSGNINGVSVQLAPEFGSVPVSIVPGLGIFFDKVGNSAMFPASFAHFLRKFATRPSVLVFFHMRPLPLPSVPQTERYVITRACLPNSYNIVLRHGYTDDVLKPGLARDIVSEIELVLSQSGVSGKRDAAAIAEELETLRAAHGSQTVYVLGKEVTKIRAGSNFIRRFLLSMYLWMRENTRTKLANLALDPQEVIEVGFVKEI